MTEQKLTRELEQAIVMRLLENIVHEGFAPEVEGYETLPETRDVPTLLARVLDLDDCIIRWNDRRRWVRLVFGNGWDLISDYSVNLEACAWFAALLKVIENQAVSVSLLGPRLGAGRT